MLARCFKKYNIHKIKNPLWKMFWKTLRVFVCRQTRGCAEESDPLSIIQHVPPCSALIGHHYERILKDYEPSAGTHRDSSGNNNVSTPSPKLKLLCGADFLNTFKIPGLWLDDHVEDLVGHFGLVCVSRGSLQPEQVLHTSDTLYRHRQIIFLVREWVRNETSATEVRRALRRGLSIKYLIADSVVEYIQEHSLYMEDSEKRNEGAVLRPLVKQAHQPIKSLIA